MRLQHTFFQLTLPVLVLITSQPLFATIGYPQLALGGGFDVVVIISNHGAAAWEGRGVLRQNDDQLWSTRWSLNGDDRTDTSEFSIALGSNATTKFVLAGDEVARAGYFRIFADEGLTTQNVTVSFFYNLSQSSATAGSGPGASLADSIGVAASPANTRFVLPVEKTATVDTGFAWAPFSIVSGFTVTIALCDEAGVQIQERELTFEGHLGQFFSQAFENVPDGFVGKMIIESEELIYLTALRLEFNASGFQLTSVPPDEDLRLESPSFFQGEIIPINNTCDGANLSPPLNWTRAPEGVQSWVVIVEDPDAPSGIFTHWIMFNLEPRFRLFLERNPSSVLFGDIRQGRNDFGVTEYRGPCPPPGPPHRYFFRLFALETMLDLPNGSSREAILNAMQGHVIGTSQWMGRYGRD